MDSVHHCTIVTLEVICETCTIHQEYHEERVRKILGYLDLSIRPISRLSRVRCFPKRYRDFVIGDDSDLFNYIDTNWNAEI